MVNVAYIYKRDIEGKGIDRTYCVLHVRDGGKLEDKPRNTLRIKDAKPEEYKDIISSAVHYFSAGYGIDFNKPPEVPEIEPVDGNTRDIWRNYELGPRSGDILRAIREYRENLEEKILTDSKHHTN